MKWSDLCLDVFTSKASLKQKLVKQNQLNAKATYINSSQTKCCSQSKFYLVVTKHMYCILPKQCLRGGKINSNIPTETIHTIMLELRVHVHTTNRKHGKAKTQVSKYTLNANCKKAYICGGVRSYILNNFFFKITPILMYILINFLVQNNVDMLFW